MRPAPPSSSQVTSESVEQSAPEYRDIAPSVIVPVPVSIVTVPDAGAVNENQTSLLLYKLHDGAGTLVVLVDPTVVEEVGEQEAPTVSDVAVQGLSFAGWAKRLREIVIKKIV
jgi:hypothetical protein